MERRYLVVNESARRIISDHTSEQDAIDAAMAIALQQPGVSFLAVRVIGSATTLPLAVEWTPAEDEAQS